MNDFAGMRPMLAVDYGRIARKGMMELGRGGACVPARVALQGRIHRSFPVHNACIFGMETLLRGRSGGHTGTAPTILQHTSPFCKGENKKFGACGASAKVKTENLVLAELPQIAKQKIWRLRSFRK